MGKVLHASYSGYFPYCLANYTDPIFNIFTPINLTLAMKLYWRLKKFRFYGTYTDNDGVLREYSINVESNAGSEEELVCNPGWAVSLVNITADGFSMGLTQVSEGGYVPELAFGGFFLNVPQETGFTVLTPAYIETVGLPTYNFEGVTLYQQPEFNNIGTQNHEILEYWSYGGTYNTQKGEAL